MSPASYPGKVMTSDHRDLVPGMQAISITVRPRHVLWPMPRASLRLSRVQAVVFVLRESRVTLLNAPDAVLTPR